MAFLDAFGPAHRAILESSAQAMPLSRGQYLLRRGEPGGDVFVVRDGTLEAVDGRTLPETILNTLPAGSVVGEMAFLDDSPRSVDVRAGSDVSVLRWTRDDLRSVLDGHPDLAAAFYENVARLASGRVRSLSDGAVRGAYGHETQGAADATEVRAWADRIADRVQATFPAVETALRANPEDPVAIARAFDVMDHLQRDLTELFEATTDPVSRVLASEHLIRELHAYLVRSSLAERAGCRSAGSVGTAEFLAQVAADRPAGEGRLGEVIDRWLLDRPTLKALRDLPRPLVDQILRSLPRYGERRVLIIGSGVLVQQLCESLVEPTVVTVIDQSRDTLRTALSTAVAEVRPIQENLTRFASGRVTLELPRQDLIVLNGLIEYLPERLAVSLLTVASTLIPDDGLILVGTLAPSDDQVVVDRILAWPTVRRTDEALEGLVKGAGLRIAGFPAAADPGRVLLLGREDDAPTVQADRARAFGLEPGDR